MSPESSFIPSGGNELQANPLNITQSEAGGTFLHVAQDTDLYPVRGLTKTGVVQYSSVHVVRLIHQGVIEGIVYNGRSWLTARGLEQILTRQSGPHEPHYTRGRRPGKGVRGNNTEV